MKEVTEKGVTFNESEPGEWIVVHIEKQIKLHGQSTGKVQTKQTMFTGTEQEVLDYIETNNLIAIEE